MNLVLRGASIAPGLNQDVTIVDGVVSAIGEHRTLGAEADLVVDLGGRPLIPGLTDNHIHLMATAASFRSVDLSPNSLNLSSGIGASLKQARRINPNGWLRGIAYDVDASGALDRFALDEIGVGPIRVQDRTGALWVLGSTALAQVLPESSDDWPDGIQLDASGEPTGVLFRLDHWLRDRLAVLEPNGAERVAAGLLGLGAQLASLGITSVTDAGADNGVEEVELLLGAQMPQRVRVMTSAAADPTELAMHSSHIGPVKILLDDSNLPGTDELDEVFLAARSQRRNVALHCVTDVQLALALAAGVGPGDRIEHGTYISQQLMGPLAHSGATVVVQPGLVFSRGDRYIQQHAPEELPALHRLGSLIDAGIPVAASSDAPYGSPNPWLAISAASKRETSGGQVLGYDERIDSLRALELYLGVSPRVSVGEKADLVVLGDGWDKLANHPEVEATIIGGEVIWGSLS